MVLNLIHDLPREIRDEIYSYVLSSPTGSIVLCENYNSNGHYKLAPISPLHSLSNGVVPKTYEPDEMGLSLLRTCKQIHDETKDMFWKLNIYKVELPWLPCRSFTRLDLGICRNVTRVSMEIKYPQPTESKDEDLENTEKAFEELGKWARDGRLKTVTVIPGVNWSGVQFDRLMLLGRRSDVNSHADERFGRFLALLRAGSQFSLTGVERKIALDTKWPKLDMVQKHAWKKVQKAKEGDINWVFTPATFLEQVHDAWNGDLFVDGKLCYRNRDLVAEPFILKMDKNC